MDNEAIAVNRSINSAILECFKRIASTDVPKFRRKFLAYAGDNDQLMHTFRELLVGTYFAKLGRRASYEMKHHGVEPDWTLLTGQGGIECIVELTNFHTSKEIEDEIQSTLTRNETYCEWVPEPNHRLYQSIQTKVDRYDTLVTKLGCPYIVAVHTDIFAAVDADEIVEVLTSSFGGGIFAYSDRISGVLVFEENGANYYFKYIPNTTARHGFNVICDWLWG